MAFFSISFLTGTYLSIADFLGLRVLTGFFFVAVAFAAGFDFGDSFQNKHRGMIHTYISTL